MFFTLLLLSYYTLVLFPARVVLVLLGFVMVALALPFAEKDYSAEDARVILNLPRWAYVWGNDFDGALGDKKGLWAADTPFGVSVDSFLAKYWWLAVRNPANNMRRLKWFNAPVSGIPFVYWGQELVADKVGLTGWQLVRFNYSDGTWPRVGWYWVKAYGSNGKCLVMRFGYKVEPRYSKMTEEPKGIAFTITPAKTISTNV